MWFGGCERLVLTALVICERHFLLMRSFSNEVPPKASLCFAFTCTWTHQKKKKKKILTTKPTLLLLLPSVESKKKS